ncbi:hypothetical protein ABIA39_008615 [Nocardia sp. GAS34]
MEARRPWGFSARSRRSPAESLPKSPTRCRICASVSIRCASTANRAYPMTFRSCCITWATTPCIMARPARPPRTDHQSPALSVLCARRVVRTRRRRMWVGCRSWSRGSRSHRRGPLVGCAYRRGGTGPAATGRGHAGSGAPRGRHHRRGSPARASDQRGGPIRRARRGSARLRGGARRSGGCRCLGRWCRICPGDGMFLRIRRRRSRRLSRVCL